jgi:predicted anti-sigma-YlaC factor YlaD
MTHNRRIENSAEHREISTLLPWYVNETLAEQDRQRVDAHLGVCASCREDLTAQQRICAAIEAQPALDYMPVASLKRLQARLDAESASAGEPAPAHRPAYRLPWRGWMAASIAVMAVAVSLLAADRWARIEERLTQPKYRTVTTSAPRPQGEAIRAVFSPTITLVELQSILDEAQLRIVSGPTEAGVYSLASNSTLPVSASLALLRRHSTVRFAEGTLPEPEPGNSP